MLALAAAAACAGPQASGPSASANGPVADDAAAPASSGAGRQAAGAQQRYAFAIPRMALRAALDHYHAVTGLSLLYDDALAQGRLAGPLHGDYTAEAALHGLLAGTGVAARYTSDQAFMLVPEAPAGQAHARARRAAPAALDAARRQVYYARLQAGVVAALCGDPDTIPGGYRLALKVWIEAGAVAGLALHPTGDAARDERIRRRLQGLALAALPPAEVAQPVTLLILPRAPAQSGDCAGAAAGDMASVARLSSGRGVRPDEVAAQRRERMR